ncbi:hypothetical protein [Streptomyces sp. NPDC051364]
MPNDPRIAGELAHYYKFGELLEKAWKDGDGAALGKSFEAMKELQKDAVELMQIKRPDGEDIATYGPEFLVV